MEYTKLGRTGLDVSRICLGCMSYGGGNQGNHAWSLGEEESRPFIKKALESGINFFDTANRYSLGNSEEVLGRAIKDFARRDEVVIATKVYGRMRPGPNGAGLSRKAIFAEIDKSLCRLGMDYVDLYQIHRFDHETPIEAWFNRRFLGNTDASKRPGFEARISVGRLSCAGGRPASPDHACWG
jgi:1-deoxyxylulose-5-phosphate synthase